LVAEDVWDEDIDSSVSVDETKRKVREFLS
jgi:hypothetical protein